MLTKLSWGSLTRWMLVKSIFHLFSSVFALISNSCLFIHILYSCTCLKMCIYVFNYVCISICGSCFVSSLLPVCHSRCHPLPVCPITGLKFTYVCLQCWSQLIGVLESHSNKNIDCQLCLNNWQLCCLINIVLLSFV